MLLYIYNMTKTSYDSPAVRKAIKLFTLLCESQKPLGCTKIATELKLNTNMVFRLLKTLIDENWVVESEDGLKYTASLLPYHHAIKPLKKLQFTQLAAKPLNDLWDQTHESCYLGIIDGTKTYFLEHLDAIGDIRVVASPGGRFNMHCAAPGKVLLAYSNQSFVEKVIAKEGLPKQTKNTITNKEELFKELEKIRDMKYGLDIEEFTDGLICFAAPVFDYNSQLVGTIGLSVLTLYYTVEKMVNELGPLVVEAANNISIAMGYNGGDIKI